MLVTLGFFLFGLLLWQTSEPPDIAGQWVGGEWGTVVLKAADLNRYTGTTANATHALGAIRVGANGTIELMWSRLQGRFNGHWKQDGDHSGKVSLRLVGKEIHGAWTMKKSSAVNDVTPRLSELVWRRREAEQADTANSIFDRTNARAVAEMSIPVRSLARFPVWLVCG